MSKVGIKEHGHTPLKIIYFGNREGFSAAKFGFN